MTEHTWRILEMLTAAGALGFVYAALRWLVLRLVRAIRVRRATLEAVSTLLDASHDQQHYLSAAADADEITRRRVELRRRIGEARAQLWKARGGI